MASIPNLTRKTLVVAKSELAYASNAFVNAATMESQLITSASCALLLWDEVNPISLDTQVVEKQVLRASFSKYKDLIGRQLYMVKPKTMWMNSPGGQNNVPDVGPGTGDFAGAAPLKGRPPFFGHLLRSCGLKETVSLSSSVVYTPVSSNFKSTTIYVYADQLRHEVLGCYGTAQIEGRAGEGLEVSFDMKGKYADPTANGVPAGIVYPQDTKELIEDASGSDSLTVSAHSGVGAAAIIVRSFRFDLGVQIVERRDFNSPDGLYGLWIIDRKPTLELVVEVDTLSVFNPWADIDDQTTHSISFAHGGATNRISTFSFSAAQLTGLNYQDDGGIRTYQLQYSLTSVGDDQEYSVTLA